MDLSIPQLSQTRTLRMEQPASDDKEVGERGGHFEPMQVLRHFGVSQCLITLDQKCSRMPPEQVRSPGILRA